MDGWIQYEFSENKKEEEDERNVELSFEVFKRRKGKRDEFLYSYL
jgi:hypothetical protein